MRLNGYYITSVLLAWVLLPAFFLPKATAQFSDVSAASRVAPEGVTNIFATWDGRTSAAGVRVELPVGWTLREASALRYGAEPVAATVRTAGTAENVFIVRFQQPLEAPHELVFQVDPSGAAGQGVWTLTPFKEAGGRRQALDFETVRRRVYIERDNPPPVENRVGVFEEGEGEPLLLRPEALPLLDGSEPYILRFRLHTTGLNEVVLSTWTGEETRPYGLDVVIDAAGRLRVYRGSPGRHWLLRSPQPVATGDWREAHLTYAPDDAWRLAIDGIVVDSMEAPLPTLNLADAPLAVGARISGGAAFTGMMDNLTLQSTGDAGAIHLSFEERAASVQQWPERLRRVREAVEQRSDMQLRAEMGDAGVVLRWIGGDTPRATYVIERSQDGQTFHPITRIDAAEGIRDRGRTVFRFTDTEMPGSVLFYRVRRIGPNGEALSSTFKIGLGQLDQAQATLIGNFPNPFQTQTTISYNVHEAGPVQLSMWSIFGKHIRTIVDREHAPGHYEVPLTASNLPSGTYLLQMQTRSGTQSHKMILIR